MKTMFRHLLGLALAVCLLLSVAAAETAQPVATAHKAVDVVLDGDLSERKIHRCACWKTCSARRTRTGWNWLSAAVFCNGPAMRKADPDWKVHLEGSSWYLLRQNASIFHANVVQ